MSTNAQQTTMQLYPQTYATADIDLHTATQHHGDPLDSSPYMIPASAQVRSTHAHPTPLVHHQQQLLSEGHIPPYPEFKLPYQNNPPGHLPGYESPRDGRLDSPLDSKIPYDRRIHGSISEIPERRMSAASMGQHRGSVTSVGKGGFPMRNGSIDGSEVTSPISSQGMGTRTSDESVPQIQHSGACDGMGEDSKNHDNKDKPPPWSELKTKAGKERKRLPLACIACRRKKIRCSGEKPACKHCLRSRIPCVYKVTTRKAAPRTDYMAMLDKRLKRMEERVIKIIPIQETGKLSSIGRANVKPSSVQPPKTNGTKKRAADEAFSNDLEEWSQSSMNRTGHTRHVSGVDYTENRLLAEGAESLPPKEIQEHLSEVFFDCLYGQSYHLLHKPSFMRRLRAGTIPPVLILAVCAVAARFSTHPQVACSDPAFLRGEPWAKPARDIVLRRYDEPNITILTVLLILGLHEFGTCHGGRSWMLGGMAIRMAYALQLHRELDHDPLGRKQDKSSELSFTDREIRRRTMWACFLMDRFNSSGTERPPFANEENIQVQLPIKESHFQMEVPGPTESLDGSVPNPVSPDAGQVSDPKENMGVAAYLVRIIALWGRVIKYLNLGGKQRDRHPIWHAESQFADLKAQAEDYQKTLPDRLQYNIENLQAHAAEKLANQFLFMHIAFNQVVLFLHKFAIPASFGGRIPKELPTEFVNDSAQTALHAAGQISFLLNESSPYLVAAPFVGYCAFVSSTVHVWGIFSKNAQLEVTSKRNLAYNVKFIGKMKQYWGMFHYMAENLKDIYRQHADVALKGPETAGVGDSGGGGVAARPDGAAIFQYGDWFAKYPHGVSGTDYEDPATEVKSESGNDAALSQKADLQSVEDFFSTLSPHAGRPDHAHARKAARRPARGSVHLDQQLQSQQQQQQQRLPTVKTEPHAHPPHHAHHAPLLHMPPSATAHHGTYPPHDLYAPSPTPTTGPPPLPSSSHPTFPPNSFPLLPLHHAHHQGVLLQELDRQFVFDAYAATDPAAAAAAAALPVAPSSLWDSPMVDFSQLGPGTGGGFGDVASSAWFMPFNLQPPDVGADGEFGGLGFGEGGV
ncbi:hypothetical protein MMC26_003557 [Xylographa opegraphella]|nr:hypothetical protein [Xylographa opegraphella]